MLGGGFVMRVAWLGGNGNGNFNDATKWSSGRVPGAADDVVIDTPGFVTSKDDASVASLTLASPQATLLVAGTSTNQDNDQTPHVGGTLALQAGTLDLNLLGVISGGALVQSGGTLTGLNGFVATSRSPGRWPIRR